RDAFAVLGARLAEEGAHVDEAGRENLAHAVDHVRAVRRAGKIGADIGDLAAFDEERAARFGSCGRIDEAGIGEEERAGMIGRAHWCHPFGRLRASASSTAMRTATPIST